ncbi:MAG: M48 family metallopeptidase [Bacteroidia bacterium]|nr:M48 family metallopeptidase [Bacteroidia bacterium]
MKGESYVELSIGGQMVPFQVKDTSGSKIGIRYHAADGQFQIRIPGGKWTPDAERFVKQSEAWILEHLPSIMADKHRQEAWWQEVKNGHLQIRGHRYELQVLVDRSTSFSIHENRIVLKGPAGADIRQLLELGLLHYAKKVLPILVLKQAEATGSRVKGISIKRNLRSKWGSASSLGNINLNWLLIFLPEAQIQYLIIHELMHFREMNHSDRFWAWVAQYEPNYKPLDRSLKDWGWLFGLF